MVANKRNISILKCDYYLKSSRFVGAGVCVCVCVDSNNQQNGASASHAVGVVCEKTPSVQ